MLIEFKTLPVPVPYCSYVSRNLSIPSFFSGFVKIKMESKFAGKYEPEALNEGFTRIEAKYSAAFETVFQKLGPYLYTNVFKVRMCR